MRVSARNVVQGVVKEVTKGATTSHVAIEVAPNFVITASITNESVEELGLVKGKQAFAVIKSSDVIVAVP